jgi:hypothetical protein
MVAGWLGLRFLAACAAAGAVAWGAGEAALPAAGGHNSALGNRPFDRLNPAWPDWSEASGPHLQSRRAQQQLTWLSLSGDTTAGADMMAVGAFGAFYEERAQADRGLDSAKVFSYPHREWQAF